jgi:glutamate formiminotransferase
MEEALLERGLIVHYAKGDLDHNRTVTAFSGEFVALKDGLMAIAELALDRIDLQRHVGVHPRIGALDVCPFVSLDDQTQALIPLVDEFAQELAERYSLPVYLYEKSERGRHEADLPTLRKGGFGSLLERQLDPDYGPLRANPRLGVTVVGVRDFLIALNVNFDSIHPSVAKGIARQIRDLREEGDPRFLGVRALGFLLTSRDMIQVSLNITLPNLTPIDPIVEFIRYEAACMGVQFAGTELIGVIRPRDLEGMTTIRFKPEQVVETGTLIQ